MNDGKKKKSQKHKNRTAFKIVFDTQALEKQKKVSLHNLCVRCTLQIQWKLQYNKYKKMTEPARCNFCEGKNVFRTYMKACQQCTVEKNVCAKCLESDYQHPSEVKVLQKDQKKQDRVEHHNQIDFMKTLQQRSRRTIRRGLEKGKISWDNTLEYFVDEEKNKMIGLHFRKGFTNAEDEDEDNQHSEDIMDEDDDMFGDDDDESNDQDDEENEKQDKKNNKDKKIKPQNVQEGQTKQQVEGNQNNEEGKKDQKEDSEVEGDQVNCQNDLDFEDQNDEDIDQDQQEEEEQQQKEKNKKPNKKK